MRRQPMAAKHPGRIAIAMGLVLTLGLLATGHGLVDLIAGRGGASAATADTAVQPVTLPAIVDGQPLPSLAPMLERTIPSVVNIATRATTRVQMHPLFDDPVFRHFFGTPPRQRERQTQSLGSGVVLDGPRGLILTNDHVVRDADEITVTLHDGRNLLARQVGSDPETDLALLQVGVSDLPALPLADSDQLRVGDFVVAIGNPFGLGQTVTSGIISALGRGGLALPGDQGFIQTDAPINPGNSGGALVNLNGELIGINTAIVSRSGGNVGIGFAIPANRARTIAEQLLAEGEIRRPVLGIQTQDLNAALAEAFGTEARRGVVISGLAADSPAVDAGLRVGDVIVSVGGRGIESALEFRTLLQQLGQGERVMLRVLRGRQLRDHLLVGR